MEFDELLKRVISCAIKVHRKLGSGLLESPYAQCPSPFRVLRGDTSVALRQAQAFSVPLRETWFFPLFPSLLVNHD
jgi:hypothetical protein